MRLFSLQARQAITAALAVLVVAALSHCSWEEARELARWTRNVEQHRQALPSPIQMPVHDCDHEYGCICRGATVVHAVDTSLLKAPLTDLLPVVLAPALDAVVADIASAAALSSAIHCEFSVPPMTGRQLRALYASLVI